MKDIMLKQISANLRKNCTDKKKTENISKPHSIVQQVVGLSFHLGTISNISLPGGTLLLPGGKIALPGGNILFPGGAPTGSVLA